MNVLKLFMKLDRIYNLASTTLSGELLGKNYLQEHPRMINYYGSRRREINVRGTFSF